MTGPAVAEYALAVRRRYEAAGRAEKKRVLDEFCETTGMHRKAVIRLLNRHGGPRRGNRGRPRRYGPEVVDALVKVWEAGDRMCGKLLVAVLPELLSALERHAELTLAPGEREALLSMSAATIDRRLKGWRRNLGRQPRRQAPAPTWLKSQIPIRTWSEWRDVQPGSVQADMVLHCGETTEGFYLATLTVVDVATGWIALRP